MTFWPQDLKEHAERLIADFSSRGIIAATAESCTGGLVAGILTDIPGSSAVVERGFVTYSNRAKTDMLNVKAATLDAHGAVSRETAIEMAAGALARSQAGIAVSVTGIAGPGGGSAEKPVGLVHLCARANDGRQLHREMRFGDIGRHEIRLATVKAALILLEEIAAPLAGGHQAPE